MCVYVLENGKCPCSLFNGKLKKTDTGYIIREKSNTGVKTFEDIKKTNFIKLASVKRWVDSLKKTKNKNLKLYLSNFWRICTTIDEHPDIFLQDIQVAEDAKDKFVLMLKDGKAVYIYKTQQKDPEKQSKINPQPYIEALRSFRQRNGKEIPKGFFEIERIARDTYARIHLNDRERTLAINFLNKLDPKIAKLFIIQHEIGIRVDTLFRSKPRFEKKYTIIDGQNCIYWKAIFHEKKQNRNFDKYFWSPESMEVVENLKDNEFIHDFKTIREGKLEYNKALRLVYVMLGKISDKREKWEKYEQGSDEYYYINMPSHAVRHSAVHKLMRMTGERADDVASMFWDRPETLEIYQQMGIDSILQQGLCLICNPPPDQDKKYERFCSLRHAVLYYNGYRPDDEE